MRTLALLALLAIAAIASVQLAAGYAATCDVSSIRIGALPNGPWDTIVHAKDDQIVYNIGRVPFSYEEGYVKLTFENEEDDEDRTFTVYVNDGDRSASSTTVAQVSGIVPGEDNKFKVVVSSTSQTRRQRGACTYTYTIYATQAKHDE